MRNIFTVIALLIVSPAIARGPLPSNLEHRARTISCWTVLSYVWILGGDRAEALAKERGYTDAQIQSVRKRCEKT